MNDNAEKPKVWYEVLTLPGFRPAKTKSGIEIEVSASGTTSVSSGALLDIARQRFDEMAEAEEAKTGTGK